MGKAVVYAKDAAPPVGPYSQAVKTGGFLFTSGQIPLDAAGVMADGGIQGQTKQVFKNLEALLKEAGLTFADVVKTTVFMTDLSQFGAMNDIYATYFTENPPARSTVQVAALPKGAAVEIELIAALQ